MTYFDDNSIQDSNILYTCLVDKRGKLTVVYSREVVLMKNEDETKDPLIKLEPNTEFSIERDKEGAVEVGCSVTLNVSEESKLM